MLAALKILKEQARQNKDKAELNKIQTTQKAFDDKRSRRSGNKKKRKKR